MNKIICPYCENEILEKPSKEFLGFQKYKCLSCNKENLHPLFEGYRTTYWFVLIISIIFAVISLARGNFPIPGWLSIFAIYILIKDRILRKKCHKTSKSINDSSERKDYSKLKKVGVVVGVVILVIIAFLLGTKNSEINENVEVSNKTLLEECLKQTESINPNDNFYNALDAISDCDKQYGGNSY
jgi:hypothetical protein